MKLSELSSAFPISPLELILNDCSETFQEFTIAGRVTNSLVVRASKVYSYGIANDSISLYITRDGNDIPPISIDKLSSAVLDINSYLEDGEEVIIFLKIRKVNTDCNLTIYSTSLINDYLSDQALDNLLTIYTDIGGKVLVQPWADLNRSTFSLVKGIKAVRQKMSAHNAKRYTEARSKLLHQQRLLSYCITSRQHVLPDDFDSDEGLFVHTSLVTVAGYSILTNLFHLTIDDPENESILVYTSAASNSALRVKYVELNNDWIKVLYDIYYWICKDEESKRSKLSLAREVIGKAVVVSNGILGLDKSVFDQVLSSFDLYLSNYISSFAEIRSQITNTTQELSLRITKVNDDLASSIGKTLFLVISVIGSSIILKFVQTYPGQSESLIVSERVLALGKIVVGTSILFVIYEMCNTYFTSERYLQSYKKHFILITKPLISVADKFETEMNTHVSDERSYINCRLLIYGITGLGILVIVLIRLFLI